MATRLTYRQAIEKLRNDLREVNADTDYTNRYLLDSLLIHAKWLNKREVSAGRIYRNSALFQIMPCVEVVETSTTEKCCPIKTNCKIYRTKNTLPDIWLDNNGPIIKTVSSVDRSTSFTMITPNVWSNKKDDPYQKFSKEKYCFFSEGYIWFPEHNPHRILVEALFIEDVSRIESGCGDCDDDDNKECHKFLDNIFSIPDWVEAEMFAKALEQIAGVTKRMQEDEQIDKNSNRKN